MQQSLTTNKEQVRQLIMLRAREISRQITEAAEDLGERCAERRRLGLEGTSSLASMQSGSTDTLAH